jgi:DNA-binding beta-propeller fold protein YncE
MSSASVLIGSDAIFGSYSRLVQIDPSTGAKTIIGALNDPVVGDLAWDPNHHVLYGSSTVTGQLLRIDPSTAAVTPVGSYVNAALGHSLAYDPVHDVLYGTSHLNQSLYSINPATGAATLVGPLWDPGGLDIDGLAYDATRQVMFAATVGFTSAGHPPAGLYTLNLQTAAATYVGPFGAGSTSFAQALAFDPALGLVANDTHGADFNFDNELYLINAATGSATLLGPIGKGNVLGLAFIPEPSTALLTGVLLALRVSKRAR